MSLLNKQSFFRGEVSPRMGGLTDIEEYKGGLETLENFIVLPQGGVTRRNGSKYVAEVKDSSKKTRLIPFEFSEEDSYVLEFGDQYMRAFKNEGILLGGTELLSNGKFTTDTTGWTDASHASSSISWDSGNRAVQLNASYVTQNTDDKAVATQAFSVAGVGLYTIIMKATLVTTSTDSSIINYIGIGTTSGAFDKKQEFFSTPSNGEIIELSVQLAKGTTYYATVATDSDVLTGDVTTSIDDVSIIDASTYLEIATDFLEADLDFIQYAQSADVLYLVHPDYPPQKLIRTSDTSWSISEVGLSRQPYKDDNLTNTVTLTASATTGSVTITASSATYTDKYGNTRNVFDTDCVTGVWRLRHEDESTKPKEWRPSHGAIANILGVMEVTINDLVTYNGNTYQAITEGNTGTTPPTHTTSSASNGSIEWLYVAGSYGAFKITTRTDSTHVVATVLETLPTTSATTNWEEPEWSYVNGYPGSVCFFEERLWMGGNYNKPQTIWGSRTGDFENWDFGNGDPADSCEYTIASNAVNRIQWLQSGKGLYIGTLGGEYIATGSSQSDGITPTNIRITNHSRHGSKRIMPMLVANTLIFIQKAAKRIRKLVYDYDVDAYISEDLSLLSEHISGEGIIHVDYQQEPDSILWCTREDGQVAACTYQREIKLQGWHRHIIGGTYASGIAQVVSVAIIPHSGYDQVWLIVKRTIDGSTIQYVEYLTKCNASLEDKIFMDSTLTYSGASTTSMTGLSHLEGESVAILADGLVQANKTVSSGNITLDTAASKVQMGLHKTATLKTLNLQPESARDTFQGKIKRVSEVIIRFLDSVGGKLNGDTIESTAGELFTGDKSQNYEDEYGFESKVVITQEDPLPMTILALYPRVKEGR